MRRTRREFADQGLNVVAINILKFHSLAEWRELWQKLGADDVIWASDPDQQTAKSFQVLTLGATGIIDRQGQVAYRDGGATPFDMLNTEVSKVL